MTIHPINPGDQDYSDLFDPIDSYTLPRVYDRRGGGTYTDLTVESGHNPLAGYIIRLEHREMDAAEAMMLAKYLRAAAFQCQVWDCESVPVDSSDGEVR